MVHHLKASQELETFMFHSSPSQVSLDLFRVGPNQEYENVSDVGGNEHSFGAQDCAFPTLEAQTFCPT